MSHGRNARHLTPRDSGVDDTHTIGCFVGGRSKRVAFDRSYVRLMICRPARNRLAAESCRRYIDLCVSWSGGLAVRGDHEGQAPCGVPVDLMRPRFHDRIMKDSRGNARSIVVWSDRSGIHVLDVI